MADALAPGSADPQAQLCVTVVYSPAARQVYEWVLRLAPGTTAAQAVLASPLAIAFPKVDPVGLHLCIWGRAASPAQPLRDGDRVELLRPLRVDPKVARRERFARQGARATGLFARGPRGKS
jgi:putative ubiquitin-RnfH superfamily antitoxin RatB of RatAB toxin-antitoxin module